MVLADVVLAAAPPTEALVAAPFVVFVAVPLVAPPQPVVLVLALVVDVSGDGCGSEPQAKSTGTQSEAVNQRVAVIEKALRCALKAPR
jgi:hypothetical protein